VVKDAVDAQVVLGPACDGGFYLIGATRTAPAMLQVCLLYCMHPLCMTQQYYASYCHACSAQTSHSSLALWGASPQCLPRTQSRHTRLSCGNAATRV